MLISASALLIADISPESEAVRALLPGDAVDKPQAVIDVVSVVGHALLGCEAIGDHGKVVTDRVANAQQGEPVRMFQGREGEVNTVGTVGADDEVVQQIR